MTVAELTQKHNAVVEYLRQLEQQRIDENAAMQDDIDALLARVSELESRLSEIE
ncbi:MAG: hypothetical protein PHQ58_02415 [Rhodoferax sp.]|uniref:hypothetical protein n=1 Tax=Rhodoferax sp. TaxID=50421 RepID=UPI00261533F2|nr:hypothetical protein [Rhodoferax sp.]MDD2879265.1 hypothetical protein [Rhodoferax sp.]